MLPLTEPLTEDEQQFLLRLARRVLEASVRGHQFLPPGQPEGRLRECGGAFVTLRCSGELRGCIGHVEAMKPLYETVCECAMAAALADPRFEPVAPGELAHLTLELSVLSPLHDIAPGQVELGRHGLLVSSGERRGVLLPQVPMELMWDRERFLEETCRKAGLAKDAWRHGARIQAFTTQIFAEPVESEPGRRVL
jgi:AmmeMemoRadiSam system protein A